MTNTPSWQDVYGGPLPSALPPVPRVDTPYVQTPTCAEHCSGRHEVDGLIMCPHCRVPMYQVWMHEWRGRPGIYWSTAMPVNGAPACVNGRVPNEPCRDCGQALQRT